MNKNIKICSGNAIMASIWTIWGALVGCVIKDVFTNFHFVNNVGYLGALAIGGLIVFIGACNVLYTVYHCVVSTREKTYE